MTNFYSRRANCIYLQSVNSVTLIYINIVQGDNFPKQYHALNTVFRLFHSNDEFQIFSKKINYDGQNFRAFTRQSFQVLEAAIRKSTIKKQYRKVLNISQKKTYTWASFEIKLQAYSLKLLLKKALVQVLSYKICQIFQCTFLAKHVRVTGSLICYHWTCFLRFTLTIVRGNTSLFWMS